MNEAIAELRAKSRKLQKGKYLLGLSGGADSVSLLMVLLRDVKEKRISLEAVHINHGIRGYEAEEDERFCADLCLKEGIPFRIFRAELKGKTDEASAREARFSFFRSIIEKESYDALLLAHNADDQAETFMMRLLRGSGPEGLSCMKADEMTGNLRIIRPLLYVRRQVIRDTLRADGIRWREDSSNMESVYLRNRIRMELIPMLERFSLSAVEKICDAAGMICEDQDLLNNQASDLLGRIAKGSMIDAQALANEPAPIQKRVIRLWWDQNGPALQEHTLNKKQTESIAALLHSSKGKMNLPGNTYAVRAGKYLFLKDKNVILLPPVPVSGSETLFGEFTLKTGPSEGAPGDGIMTQEVPVQFLEGCVIRTRRPGDRICPFGCAGSRKLQDYLTDRKIPEPFRDTIPLLCRNDEVMLVCGVGAGNIPRWDAEKQSVRLTWIGDIPWMA